MNANIDLVLSLVTSGRIDLLTGMKLGAEEIVPRAMTKELLAVKHHLQLLLENIDNGYIEFNNEEKIVTCNPIALQLFQRDETTVLGQSLRELFKDRSCEHVLECLDQFLVNHKLV